MQSCADYITFNVGSLLLVTHSVTTSGCFASPLRQVYSVSLQHAWLCVNECDTLKVTYSLFDDSNSKSLDFTVNRFLIKLLRPCCYRPIDVVNERRQSFLSDTRRNDKDDFLMPEFTVQAALALRSIRAARPPACPPVRRPPALSHDPGHRDNRILAYRLHWAVCVCLFCHFILFICFFSNLYHYRCGE